MTATARHEITTVSDAAEAAKALDDVAPVYEEVFAEPPYNESARDVAAFIDRYTRECRARGFRLAVAREGGEISGFAYGLPLSSSTGWWEGIEGAELSDKFTREDGRRTFALMELAVRAACRRQGLGRALHGALMDPPPGERVTLAVRPEAEAARELYRRLGYEVVGFSRPWDGAPTYVTMMRDVAGI